MHFESWTNVIEKQLHQFGSNDISVARILADSTKLKYIM